MNSRQKSRLFEEGCETLESRLMMAGDVTVSVNGHHVIVEGDAEANEIRLVTGADNSLHVIGEGGTNVIDGSTGVEPYRLTIRLGDGDDVVIISNAAIGKKLRVSTGRGNDHVTIENSLVIGDARISTGAGADLVDLNASTIERRLTIATGAADDTVSMGTEDTVHLSARSRVFLGHGDDTFRTTETGIDVAPGQSIAIDGYAGNDTVYYDQQSLPVGMARVLMLNIDNVDYDTTPLSQDDVL